MDELRELLEHEVVSDERQSVWTLRRTFVWRGHKLRATVHHDPYEFQCDFYLELFNVRELKWNRVHKEPNTWSRDFDALSTSRITAEQSECIDVLVRRMVSIGQDLLEGISA